MTERKYRSLVLTVTVLFLAVLVPMGSVLLAEFVFFSPPGGYAVEVSLENSPPPHLPMYRNAITSLEIVGDHAIGGTSADPGSSPFLFSVSLSSRRLESRLDLADLVAGQRSVCSGFGRGLSGPLWAGTLPDRDGDSGHLIEVRVEGAMLNAFDRGTPVPGEGIFALAASFDGEELYGIAHPSGRFFNYNVNSGATRVFEETALSPETLHFLGAYALTPEDVLCRRLAVDSRGRVYGSRPVSKLFRFDPNEKEIEVLPDEIPAVWGRRPLGRADSWAVGPDGLLYGGNSGDGQLFSLNPEDGSVTNLGKPIMMPGMKGLGFGRDGFLYGIAGAAPGYAHLFRYDPLGKGFLDLGNPRFLLKAPGIEQGIWWRGFQIGTLAVSEDGRWIALGEQEALSQLMVFPVN